MTYLKIIISCLVILVSCTNKESGQTQSSLISEKPETQSSIDEICIPLDKRFEELCGESSPSKCSLSQDKEIGEAITLLKDLPTLSEKKKEAYSRFLNKKDVTKEDVKGVLTLAPHRCKKATRFNLWKALTVNSDNKRNKTIEFAFKSNVIANFEPPRNLVELMIKLTILRSAVSGQVIKAKDGALEKLMAIRKKISERNTERSQDYDQVFQPLIPQSDNEKGDVRDFDPKEAQAYLVKEAQSVQKFDNDLKKWSKEYIL